MPYYVFFVLAHMGEKDGQFQQVRQLEIVVSEPDETEVLRRAHLLAPGRENFYIQRVVEHDPFLERPEMFRPVPRSYVNGATMPAIMAPGE